MLPFSQAAGLERYVQGATDYLDSTPYRLTIHSTEGNRQRQRELLASLTKEKWDGLIIYPENLGNSLDLVVQLQLDAFPIVLLDKKLEGTTIPTVTSDNFSGGFSGTTCNCLRTYKDYVFIHSGFIRKHLCSRPLFGLFKRLT